MSRDPQATGPVSALGTLRRVSVALGLGAVVALSLAGIPSFERMSRAPGSALLSPLAQSRNADLTRVLAELIEPVDPVTLQRPPYPTTEALARRLAPLPGWDTAVLLAVDATAAELRAAGVTDDDLVAGLSDSPMPDPLGGVHHWRLVLLDAQQRIVGSLYLAAPALQIDRFVRGDRPDAAGPQLERRFPDWPRAVVLGHPADGAGSDA